MTASTSVINEHVEIVDGAVGPKARIIGSRIRVQDIVIWHVRLGESIDSILDAFPHITRADVYAALAHCWDHQPDVDKKMADDEAYVAEMRRGHASRFQELLGEQEQRAVSKSA